MATFYLVHFLVNLCPNCIFGYQICHYSKILINSNSMRFQYKNECCDIFFQPQRQSFTTFRTYFQQQCYHNRPDTRHHTRILKYETELLTKTIFSVSVSVLRLLHYCKALLNKIYGYGKGAFLTILLVAKPLCLKMGHFNFPWLSVLTEPL